MAQNTLAALTRPDFPQVSAALLARFTEKVSRIYERSILPLCAYEYPESTSGACDGQPCCEKGTVSDPVTDQVYCLSHYQAVSRG